MERSHRGRFLSCGSEGRGGRGLIKPLLHGPLSRCPRPPCVIVTGCSPRRAVRGGCPGAQRSAAASGRLLQVCKN